MSKFLNRAKAKISERTELGPEIFSCFSYITVCGNNNIIIEGCCNIEKYEDNEIIIVACDGVIGITGQKLRLISFFGETIEIGGRISGISIGEADK